MNIRSIGLPLRATQEPRITVVRKNGGKRLSQLPAPGFRKKWLAICCTLNAGGLFVAAPVHADASAWDCQQGADGRWVCEAAPATESVVTRPLTPPPAAVTAPLGTPVAQPAPTPAKPAARPTGKAAVAEKPAAKPRPETAPAEAPRTVTYVESAKAEQPAEPAATATDAATQPAREEPAPPSAVAETPATKEPVTAARPAQEAKPTETAPAMTGERAGIVAGLDRGIDWSCGAPLVSLTPTGPDGPSAPEPGFTVVEADAAEIQLDAQVTEFSGDVQFRYGDQYVDTERLVYDRANQQVSAQGETLMGNSGVRAVSPEGAQVDLANEQATLSNAEYRVAGIKAQGSAEKIELLGEGQSRYQNITYSTCRPGYNGWAIKAEELEIDRNEGLATAHNASVRFKGMPIGYLPRLTFPIDDRRRSGFLVPSVGHSSNSGLSLSAPYYLNLAPNYDATLTPTVLQKRGLMLGGQFRFLSENHQGVFDGEFIADDNEYDNDSRGSFSLYSDSKLAERATGRIRLNYVSDDTYINDFGTSLAVTSTNYVEQTGQLNWYGDNWSAQALAQGYQPVTEDLDRPYSRLPQLIFSWADKHAASGAAYGLRSEYVYFDKDDDVTGHRLDLEPEISFPARNAWGYVIPTLSARYTTYDLQDQAPGLDNNPDRFTGTFSLDGGVTFERQTSLFGHQVTQTLEPRAFYLYTPETDQTDIPRFDTEQYGTSGELDFNYSNLFRRNRFSGADRVGDANQVTLGVSSRVIDDASGAELLRANLGQIHYFRDREVTLDEGDDSSLIDTDNTSPVIGELTGDFQNGWRARAAIEVDPNQGSGRVVQNLLQLNYQGSNQRLFNIAYRQRDDGTDADSNLEQLDLSAHWPVSPDLSLFGRMFYSLDEDKSLESLAGLEYGDCCWRLRAMVKQYSDEAGDDQNLAFMLQLQLNGLGSLGSSVDDQLRDSIYGYDNN